VLTMSKRPRVFFEITVGGKNVGRIVFELFSDVVPKTLKISVRCVRARKELGNLANHCTSKGVSFIELFQIS